MPARRTLQQAEMGLSLLMASLAVFFAAAIVATLLTSPRIVTHPGLPASMWLATGCLIGVSAAFHVANRAVRRENQLRLHRWISLATMLGLLFCAIQAQALYELVTRALTVSDQFRAWLFIGVLVALHTAHVLFGMTVLIVVWIQAHRGRFDHEYYLGLTLCARYWHFLDAVWLAVVATSWALIG